MIVNASNTIEEGDYRARIAALRSDEQFRAIISIFFTAVGSKLTHVAESLSFARSSSDGVSAAPTPKNSSQTSSSEDNSATERRAQEKKERCAAVGRCADSEAPKSSRSSREASEASEAAPRGPPLRIILLSAAVSEKFPKRRTFFENEVRFV